MSPTPPHDRIRAQLDAARHLWRAHEARIVSGATPGLQERYRFFGARKHRFELSPPLPLEAVERWEHEFGLTLPLEYRRFLTEVGGHGAGPFYGLESLLLQLDATAEKRHLLRAWYHAPCPLREDMSLGGADKEAWLRAIGGPEWEARFNADEWSPSHGTLSLCQVGCGEEIVLILNGPLRGRLCQLCEVWQSPVLHRAPDFLSWYAQWLEELLAGARAD